LLRNVSNKTDSPSRAPLIAGSFSSHAPGARNTKPPQASGWFVSVETRIRNTFCSAHRTVARSRHRGISYPVAGSVI
jgi:hypothetical protein